MDGATRLYRPLGVIRTAQIGWFAKNVARAGQTRAAGRFSRGQLRDRPGRTPPTIGGRA